MQTRSSTLRAVEQELRETQDLVNLLQARNALLLQQANAWQVAASTSIAKAARMEKSALAQLDMQRAATDKLERAERHIQLFEERFGKLPIEEDCRCDVVELSDDE